MDNTNIVKNDTINIRSLIAILFYNWPIFILSLLFFLCLSFYQVKTASQRFTSEVIFDVSQKKDNSPGSNSLISGYMSSIPSLFSMNVSSSDALLARINGTVFLERFISQKISDSMLDKYCKFNMPGFFSVRGFLNAINLSKISFPSFEQQQKNHIDCVRSFFEISYYRYRENKTPAYSVKITTPDPIFSAKTANNFAAFLFEVLEEDKESLYTKTKGLLSVELDLMEKDFEQSSRDFQNYVVDNAFRSDSYTSVMKSLARLYEEEKNLLRNKKFFENIMNKENRPLDFWKKEIQFNPYSTKKLIFDITKIIDLEKSEKELKKRLEKERREVDAALNLLQVKIGEVEEVALEGVISQEREKGLKEALVSKKSTLEGIRKMIFQRKIEAGFNNLNTNILYTKAFPSLYPSSPNMPLIIFLFVMLSVFCSFFIITIQQLRLGRIYDLNQLSFSNILKNNFVLSDRKNLNDNSLFEGGVGATVPVNIETFVTLIKQGKKICLIDITDSFARQQKAVIDRVGVYLANLLKLRPVDVALFISRPFSLDKISSSFQLGEPYNLGAEKNNSDGKVTVFGTVDTLFEKKFDWGKCGIDSQKNVIVTADKSFQLASIFNLIEKCDAYMLVGRVGKSRFSEIDKYIFDKQELKTKCLGLILLK